MSRQGKLDPATGEREAEFAYVNLETGEQFAECPVCEEMRAALSVTERKLRAAHAQIGKLEVDHERKAREHRLWDVCEGLFDWHRLACNRLGVTFTAEQFHYMLPRVRKKGGDMAFLKATAGAAFDPGTKRMKNGRITRFDSVELICRSEEKMLSFHERVPGGADSEAWKIWLVRHIEASLTNA